MRKRQKRTICDVLDGHIWEEVEGKAGEMICERCGLEAVIRIRTAEDSREK